MSKCSDRRALKELDEVLLTIWDGSELQFPLFPATVLTNKLVLLTILGAHMPYCQAVWMTSCFGACS